MRRIIIEPYIKQWCDAKEYQLINGKFEFIKIQKNAVGVINQHRYPNWMPLKFHITIERVIEKFQKQIPNILYHFIHGLICGYSCGEILQFLKFTKRKR